MPAILIDTPVDAALLERLAEETGLSVAFAPTDTGELDTQRELPAAALADVEAMLGTFVPVNLDAMPSLKLVQLCSAGYKQVEGLGLAERGVTVCTASGVNDVPIAEWVASMMVALARDLPTMFRNQQQGVWDRSARFQQEVRGRTVGIWGYGGIGRETARLATAMGLRVHVLTRSGTIDTTPRFHVEGTGDDAGALPHEIFALDDAERFCSDLDFLVLAIPATPMNLGLIDRRIFNALPDRAFLLNPARGGLVNEADLLEALTGGETSETTNGGIAGAALDTHFHYPMPPDHPLWRLPNVFMTPHISGSSNSPNFKPRLWELFCQNLRRWQTGERPLNALSPDHLRPTSASFG